MQYKQKGNPANWGQPVVQNEATAGSHLTNSLDELDLGDLDLVGGGSSTEWAVATGTAVAFTVGATVAAPVFAYALAMGGIAAAGMAIYYAATDDEVGAAS